MKPLALWGGVECTVNRVGDRYFDQSQWSGHASRLADLHQFADLGITSLRYPVLWEGVAPHSLEAANWEWPDARLQRIRALGMTPIVGLVHHGSGPLYTSLVDDAFPERLALYAGAVAERYPWVTDWTPVNEPLTTARFSGLYGHWYPHARDDTSFVRALINQVRGTALSMRAIRAVHPAARLIQTEDLGRASGTPRLRPQIALERERRWLTWDLLTGRVDRHHPLYDYLLTSGATEAELQDLVDRPCPPDVIGINYYLTSDRWLDDRLDVYPPWSHGGNGHVVYADVEAVRARPRGIAGHEQHLVDTWRRYGLPVALTEVHLGCTREEQMRWLVTAWRAAEAARARGVDVRAVTTWALLGSFDWNTLVTEERGYYEPGAFDVRSPSPRPTALAQVVKDLGAGRKLQHPVLQGEGWWQRPDRLVFGPAGRTRPSPGKRSGPPLLVVGSRGTLGNAFRRICESRGLATHLVSRAEMDICDPQAIDAVIRRVKPWAVINAAGYVRVDAAETDREACWRDNVDGPVNLAASCRRHRLPIVTFSSDLVFDGAAGRPYTEDDTPAPLNVYGAAKAEAERRVLDISPEALVIRTSAFFGPWDNYNFATIALRTVARRAPFRAASDYVVSPTYVPDLVNALLDLLIDSERGIWHLANDGSVSWLEFGRMVTRAAGLPEELIEPCSWRDIWQPAVRPSYSVLGTVRGPLLRPLDAAVHIYAAEAAAALQGDARSASF
jgi:dTDP-4-dehydrorhamnose reductase